MMKVERRSLWGLSETFTESLKDRNHTDLIQRTEARHGLLDTYIGLFAFALWRGVNVAGFKFPPVYPS